MNSPISRMPAEILLVEDNPSDARLAAEALKESPRDNRLHWVADGIQAIEFLQREGRYAAAPRPDLILLDLNLPGRDGRDILAELKTNPQLRAIPVVVLTCSDADIDRTASYDLQASCFITKPPEWDGFARTMRAIVDMWLMHPARSAGARSGSPAPTARDLTRPGNSSVKDVLWFPT